MEKQIAVRYVGGAQVRVIGKYRWEAGNGYVQKVPAALAAELMTYPRPDFELVNEADEKTIENALKGREEAES